MAIMWLVFAVCTSQRSRKNIKGASVAAGGQKWALPRYGAHSRALSRTASLSKEPAEMKGVAFHESQAITNQE